MKTLNLFIFIVLQFAFQVCISQTRTDEKKTTRDSTTGKVAVTESVIISSSEDITPRSNMLIINPLKFFLFYNLTYYYKITPSAVMGVGFQMPTIKDMSGFGINAEIRFHPSGKAPRGFYVAPNLSFNSLTFDSYHSSSTQPVSIGVLLGWQWFPGDEFAMGLGIGLDYYFSSSSSNDFTSYEGTVPALRFDIGYAW